MKQVKFYLLVVAIVICHAVVRAVPAYRGLVTMKQPDGSTIVVRIVGDEFGHYYLGDDDAILLAGADGALCYAAVDADGKLSATDRIAHGSALRSESERLFVASQNRTDILQAFERQRKEAVCRAGNAMRQIAPGKITPTFPTTGEVEGLVILAEYQDVKFSTPDIGDVYAQLANQENYSGSYASGSVRDYFVDQSSGLFKPHFTVVGPVTLPHDRAYYGIDEKNAQMIIDACEEAKLQGVDFSKFDADNDGNVDFVFVVYAGYGEAQGGPSESVWPSAVDLTYESWKTYDGLYLGKSACSCELHGNQGTLLDGIGTFVHEFSHILGLADIYDTNRAGSGFGMSDWDVMDHGCYNDDSKTPSGYTAMDKYTVGWLTPVVLENAAKDYRLNALSTSNEAFFIVNPAESNEYYTLENRQPVKWDKGLPGHGLIISHVHYVRSLWGANRVNASNSGYEHVALMAADNNKSSTTFAGDPFPGTSHNVAFTDNSSPAAFWHVGAAGVNAPLTNIREQDGVILFDFKSDETAVSEQVATGMPTMVATEGTLLIANPAKTEVRVLDVTGKLVYRSKASSVSLSLPRATYIVATDGYSRKINVE